MSYYQRPMGDYKTYGYAGDPGWLSSIWRGIKRVAPAIIGGVIGGPIGVGVGGAAGGGGGGAQPPATVPPGTIGGAISFPGGTTVSTAYTGGPRPPATAAGGCGMSGYHYAKDGSGRLVRNRRMNVANPKALRKAMRRVQGFEKLAKRTIQFTRRVRMKK